MSHASKLRSMCKRWKRPQSDRATLAALICGYAYAHPDAFASCIGIESFQGAAWLVRECANEMIRNPPPNGADYDTAVIHASAKVIAHAVNGVAS